MTLKSPRVTTESVQLMSLSPAPGAGTITWLCDRNIPSLSKVPSHFKIYLGKYICFCNQLGFLK